MGNIKHPFWALVLLITTEAIMKATTAQKVEQATQSYHRVINGSSKNDTVVIQAFLDRGIWAGHIGLFN